MTLDLPQPEGAPLIPAAQIAETRRCFPDDILLFEVQLAAPTPWQALGFCAQGFAQAGLELAGLRCWENGVVLCKLRDRPEARLDCLERAIAEAPEIRLCRWTTVLASARSPKIRACGTSCDHPLN